MEELKMRKHMKERFSGNDNILYNQPLLQNLNIEINKIQNIIINPFLIILQN